MSEQEVTKNVFEASQGVQDLLAEVKVLKFKGESEVKVDKETFPLANFTLSGQWNMVESPPVAPSMFTLKKVYTKEGPVQEVAGEYFRLFVGVPDILPATLDEAIAAIKAYGKLDPEETLRLVQDWFRQMLALPVANALHQKYSREIAQAFKGKPSGKSPKSPKGKLRKMKV